MCLKAVTLFFVVLSAVKVTEACNGYSLKMDYVKLCMDDSLIQPKNINFSFDPNCNLVLNGCLNFKKPMKTSKATYEVTKSPMPTITGEIDLCTLFANAKSMVVSQQMIESYGLPKKCPVPENLPTMPMKEWVRRMQPFQLYVVLGLTITFFLVELIVSHLTHALTLLMDSYHTLVNIMALGGCIVTIKYAKDTPQQVFNLKKGSSLSESVGEELCSNPAKCQDEKKPKTSVTRSNQEKKLKNTFGWARIDVIFMLICCVFLASLSFSILVEALQTLVHIDHHDEMHHSISVLCIGAAGLLLNGVCYLLIGGYTFHQGSFLYVTESGNVVLSKIVVDQSLQQGARRLSRSKTIHPNVKNHKQRQGFWEMTRDVSGCILVVICAILVYFSDKDTAKYIDPILSLASSAITMFLSYPYMKESCLILLQTMPDTIDIDSLKIQLLNHFPDIVNIHDFHIWQLTANKVISTVHIIFQNPKAYKRLIEEVKDFFNDNGITQVTIQPEFFKKNESMDSLTVKFAPNCLVTCLEERCKDHHCCPPHQDKQITKSRSKEVIPGTTTPELKSVRTLNDELSSQFGSEPSIKSSQRFEGQPPSYDSLVDSEENITTTKTNSLEKLNKNIGDNSTKDTSVGVSKNDQWENEKDEKNKLEKNRDIH